MTPPAPASVVETAPTTPTDPCLPLADDQVSDDETPSIAGTMERVNAGVWLEARGISRAAFRAWVRSRGLFANYAPYLADSPSAVADQLFDVELPFPERVCLTLKVGDENEDALACPLLTSTLLRREAAAVFVVRDQRIVPVLEVGYALRMLEFPDRRWLDLQLAFAPDGLEVEVHDRAKPGAVLVESPRSCREDYARYFACEKARDEGVATGNGCPLPSGPGEPIALFGCAAALPRLATFVKETAADPSSPYTSEVRADRDFAIKSCAARGHYTWKAGRFVRASR